MKSTYNIYAVGILIGGWVTSILFTFDNIILVCILDIALVLLGGFAVKFIANIFQRI